VKMRHRFVQIPVIVLLAIITLGCSLELNPSNVPTQVIGLPGTTGPIYFDDMVYDAKLGKVLIPANETGKLVLIDPSTRKVQDIAGFTPQKNASGQMEGITSITTGRDVLFTTNRGALSLSVIDPTSGSIISSTAVMSIPDYVRYISATGEVWVTESAMGQIEVFSLPAGKNTAPVHSGVIPVPDGPESLVIDKLNGLAYTNRPGKGLTEVINVFTHNIVKEWGNGCSQARGLALDEKNGFLFVACQEGKIVILDTNNGGAQLTSQTFGGDLNLISYNPSLQHLYLPSSASALLVIFKVAKTVNGSQINATLSELGTADTALGSGCVISDDHNNIWVCDPNHGQVLLIRDIFSGSKN
jgi:DNA-binding beta-propeller fold protein YncE